MKISDFRELIKGQTGDRIMSGKKPEGNKKVRNAKKVVSEDGRTYDSALELNFRNFLLENKIEFTEKHHIRILDGVKNINGTFSRMDMIPDFYIEELNLVIDTKGSATDRFREKYRVLNMVHPNPPIYIFVRSKKMFLPALYFIRELKKGKINHELLESMSYKRVFNKSKHKNLLTKK